MITGHHVVRLFPYSTNGEETELLEGWKPYANAVFNGTNMIVARKWVRDIPKVDAVAWAEATTREAANVASQR